MHLSDCSCAPILQFYDAALEGVTANRQILDPIFSQFFTSLTFSLLEPSQRRVTRLAHIAAEASWHALEMYVG